MDVTPNILNIWRQMNVVLQCEDDTRGGGGGGGGSSGDKGRLAAPLWISSNMFGGGIMS